MNTEVRVTAEIITKNRYFTTLPLCISSLITQTHKLAGIIIIDDGDKIDLRECPIYKHLFHMLDIKSILWKVLFNNVMGVCNAHQIALDECQTDWIWRIDDDCIAEPNALQEMVNSIDNKTGAVGGLIINPSNDKINTKSSSKIEDVYKCPNYQWFIPYDMSVKQVDHLYSSFLYRKSAALHGYCKELSPVGYREETIFTHEMKLNGWEIKINPNSYIHHLMNPEGGIRSYTDKNLWDHDEEIFKQKMEYWKLLKPNTKIIVLDNGIGDHFAFKTILDEVLTKYDHVIIACCYPDVFYDYLNLNLVSICAIPNNLRENSNVYKFMQEQKEQMNVVDAFRKLYL
jgi:glycosyltransferase involved in cell wall biosynthesis